MTTTTRSGLRELAAKWRKAAAALDAAELRSVADMARAECYRSRADELEAALTSREAGEGAKEARSWIGIQETDAEDNAGYIEFSADTLAKLGYQVTASVLRQIAGEYRALYAAPPPVAGEEPGPLSFEAQQARFRERNPPDATPPPAALPGWVMVPREPTKWMRYAGRDAHNEAERAALDGGSENWQRFGLRENRASHVYAAMLRAAPNPPVAGAAKGVETEGAVMCASNLAAPVAAAQPAEGVVDENARLREALSDLLSWFPDKPSPPEWRIEAGERGADDAVAAARAALHPTSGGSNEG